MERLTDMLRLIIQPLGWITAPLALLTPLWFLIAALGTKLSFWGWEFGLSWMTLDIGPKLILACAITGVLMTVLVVAHRLMTQRWFGVISVPILALLIAIGGYGGRYVFDGLADSRPTLLDVTTDFQDPPHFTPAYAARRGSAQRSLDFDPSGMQLQAEYYPGITSLTVEREAGAVFREALMYGREAGWRIGTASDAAGMFEAGAESLMFGFRDDIAVRVTELEDGRSQVDIRSLARQPVHDLGRNAKRVERFLAAMGGEGEAG
ncbi:DUF1499 domain-containing protein [Maricaulis maris]|uniref:Uncharacterized protein DUF1499 n=1 Tax=Maricaulis maris TaxID=74318 RepID=A0A495D109_9PROT|nr:DUF1499 domain-containing protein [Maricaulis maris]RKQ95176.1 uncharacterized protein DUF1499 [Maricaulis maris]